MNQQQWRPATHDDYDGLVGSEVYTRDGELIGRIDRIVHPTPEGEAAGLDHHLVVRPEVLGGPLGTDVAYIPDSAIAAVSQDKVELTTHVGELADQGWAHLPVNLEPETAPLPEDVPEVPEGGWYEENHRETE